MQRICRVLPRPKRCLNYRYHPSMFGFRGVYPGIWPRESIPSMLYFGYVLRPNQADIVQTLSNRSQKMERRVLVMFCLALCAACSNSEAPHDSNIVPQIEFVESLRLGDEAAGDTMLFGSIDQLAVTSRGDVIVTAVRPATIQAFDAEGDFLGTIGAEGEGPGEYRYVSHTVVGSGDSVHVFEYLLNRILIYSPGDYTFARHVQVTDAGSKQMTGLLGVLDDGWLMTMEWPSFLRQDDGSMVANDNREIEVVKVDLDGSYSSDPIAIMREQELILNVQEGAFGFNIVSVPFGRYTWRAVGLDGLLYYGYNDSIRISMVSSDGSDQGVISHDVEPIPVTGAELQKERHSQSAAFQELLDTRPPHETKPAFETFVINESGHVWVKLSSAEGSMDATWLALNRESEAVGQTTLPKSVTLQAIRNGRAYGVDHPEGEAPMVVVYELLK